MRLVSVISKELSVRPKEESNRKMLIRKGKNTAPIELNFGRDSTNVNKLCRKLKLHQEVITVPMKREHCTNKKRGVWLGDITEGLSSQLLRHTIETQLQYTTMSYF